MSHLFRPSSVASLAGAAVAVTVVTKVVTNVFHFQAQWFPLVVAVVVSIVGYLIATSSGDVELARTPRVARYILVLLNGFLIYASAFGVQGTISAEEVVPADAQGAHSDIKQPVGSVSPWKPLVSRSQVTAKRLPPNPQRNGH
jgi:hypothetical protein